MANINCYRNSRKQLGFLKGSSFLYHFFHLGYFFPPTFNCAGTPAYKWSLSFRVPSSNSRHMPTSVCYSVFLVEKANILIVKQRLFRFHYILFFFFPKWFASWVLFDCTANYNQPFWWPSVEGSWDSTGPASLGDWSGVGEKTPAYSTSTYSLLIFASFEFFFFSNIEGVTSNYFSFNLQRWRYAICMAIIIYLYFH